MASLTSFIIPHKGRESLLLKTLSSIAELECKPSDIEVILVSQNQSISKDVMDSVGNIKIKTIICESKLTISELRNCGVNASNGEWLAFLDADVALSSNWLRSMLAELHSHKGAVLSSAMQENSVDAPPLERIRTALSNISVNQSVTFLPGRNLFVHRKTFDAVGGFPAHLLTCEDYYFTERVSQLGSLIYTDKASYIHLGEDKVYKEMFHKEIWRGQSNLASIKGRNIPIREFPSFIVPFIVTGGFILIVIGAILQSMFLFFLGVSSFLLPIIAYSVRLFCYSSKNVNLFNIAKFYIIYFHARAFGSVVGAFKKIKTDSHN